MKKLLPLLLIFAACNSNPKTVQVPETIKDTTVQVCDFDIKPTEFNITERQLPPEEAAKGPQTIAVRNPSSPGAGKIPGVALIDFDGHTVHGTSWNFYGDIVCADAGLTVQEQQIIVDTIAYRYRNFNIIVTTDTNVYNKAPAYKRTRCIITKTYEWFGMSGGVSFVGSFKWGDNTPCFVFSLLLNYNLKFIQEAATHEIGHTLGLYHQCLWNGTVKVSEYRPGVIMGNGYYVPSPPWAVGANAYNRVQVDTAIIRASLQ